MAAQGNTRMGGGLDFLNWPVAIVSLGILPFLHDLWHHMPTGTAVYTTISAGFMLFQMADKMGWLDFLKRTRSKDDEKRP